MNYKTHNQKEIDVNGAIFQGELITTYDKLVEAFGKPTISNKYKIDAEWVIEFYPENEKEPVIATINNWKIGAEGWDIEEITYWHIGGYKPIVNEYVKDILDNIHIDYLNTLNNTDDDKN